MNERATLLTTTGSAGLRRVCLMKLEMEIKGYYILEHIIHQRNFPHFFFFNEILAATLK